jgi:hypothetical protein
MIRPLVVAVVALALTLAGCGAGPAFRALPQAQAGPMATRAADPAKFFANARVQRQMPMAFAVQAAALPALEAMTREAAPEREALVAAIRADRALKSAIDRFASLTWAERLPVLKQVMAIECRVMGYPAPPLVIGEGDQRAAYFDFDPARPDTGRVILYPDGLAKEENPYAALLLLVHETRHSAQFQRAYAPGASDPAALGFKAAFEAQRRLAGQLSFCDFCTLLNEHEAFQSANEVVGRLTDWRVDTADMGCLSSQYDAAGKLRIDLLALAERVGPANLLGAFNQLEQPHWEQLTGGR